MTSSSDNYDETVKRRYPGYRFSWEIYTDIMLENVAGKPYWLDIGAGPNILIEEQPGFEFAVGLDIEKPDNAFVPRNSVYCLADCTLLPFKAESFDFITSRFTFEHLAAPLTALHEVARVLKPRGLFALQTTNKRNPLVIVSRVIPFALKRIIFPVLFKDNPSGTFKTRYKMNTARDIPPAIGGLKLEKLILVEDILRHNPFLYFISSFVFRIIRLFRLDNLKGNIIAIYRKDDRI
jgi:SAM-dependent methyltransferase